VTSQPLQLRTEGGGGDFAVPDVPLGDYQVQISPTCAVPLKVRSPAPLTMSQFSPPGAYTEPNDGPVHFTIRGTGFIVDRPEENRIYANGMDLTVATANLPGLVWGSAQNPNRVTCGPGQRKGDGKPAAFVESADVIHVCNVPARIGDLPNGGWLGDLKLRPRLLSIAVGQFGVAPTDPWPFRIYPFWAGMKVVVLIATGVALVLVGLVLWCVHRYRQTRTAPTTGQFGLWEMLFIDLETDTYSLSKFQFYLWTIAAVFAYSYLVISKVLVQGAAWPEIPNNLPGIIGIGVGTAVGAQVATNIRGPKGSGTERPSLGDFVMSGGVVAADRVQMLVWTVLGVGIFCVSVLKYSPGDLGALDTIPETLLIMGGLSAFGYLGGKLARKPGPVVDEIHIEPAESDEELAASAVPPPGTVDLTSAVTRAQNVVLPAPAAVQAKSAVDALTESKELVTAVKTVSQAAAALPQLAAKRQIAETGAKAAAEAMVKANTPETALAAETAQRAAAAIDDLEVAVRAAAGTFANRPVDAPQFERVITLRGRNLSPNGIFSIDGLALPFRMLRPNPLDPAATRVAEVLIPEIGDPSLAMSLRLTIDPGQLAAADRAAYDKWFKIGRSEAHVLKITNLDGQQDDLSFTVPPGAAQAAGKGGAAQQGAKP
jgi:hypothetical protein